METITISYKKVALAIGLILITSLGHSQYTITYSTSGTFIVPAGVTSVQAEAWGAGGAGGGNTLTEDGSGGGGGGAYSKNPSIAITSGSSHDVIVGAGGTGGTGIGGNGGDSYFSTILTLLAKGGSGGNPPILGAGGIGGNGGSSLSGVGTTKFSGGNGGTGRNSSGGHAGPGATSAGTASNGLSGATSWSTINAPTPVPTGAGAGAAGGSVGNNGSSNTSSLGGGGGGGADRTTVNTIGGDGADGRVILTWTCPTYALTSAASNSGPICSLSSTIVTVRSTSLPSGTYNVTYNLSGSTSAIGNTATMDFTAGSPGTGTFSTSALSSGSTTVTITNLSSGSGCSSTISTSNTTNVTANSNLPSSVSINATANTICAGTNVTFTATPTNGGTNPTYQWKLNGSNVGTNSATYSNNLLTNGNIVSCVMTSNATPCLTGSPATSNTVTMTVNSYVTASVNISASASSICAGTNVNFTATPINGGTTPVYQWKLNGTNVGTNSATYSNSTLANGNTVTCVLTSNATPCLNGSPATSNTVTMTVTANVAASVGIVATHTTICAGANVTFTATPTNGGTTPVYQWKLNGGNVGINSSTYSNNALTNGNTISCIVTSNVTPCITGSPATSNTITMTVNPMLTASVSISASSTTICAGINTTFTAVPTNGGTTPSYQWKLNGTNVGINSATYSNNALVNADAVTCVMTSNATPCLTSSPATSNTITMTVNPNIIASVSISATNTTTCAGISETFTATPTNGGTTPIYQWKKNGTNVGTNSPTYSSATLANGDVITCVMTSSATCVSPVSATSNPITLTVNPAPTITSSTPGSRINTGTVVLGATCSFGSVFWYTTLVGGGPIGSGNSWTTPSISTTTTYYASAMTLSGCSSTPRTAVVATVNNPEIDVQGNATSIVDGDTTPSTTDFTDFSTTNTTRTFTIRNTGAAILNVGPISFSGADAADFSVTTAPSSTVAIGSSTTFIVSFYPTAGGTRTATISITNDDNNENPYDFTIQGTGIAQEITVQGNAVTINDGDNTPTTTDWTDFSNVTFTRTYTIQNSGNVALTIGSIAFSGPNAAEFAVTTPAVSPVAGNSTTTFTVTFSPLGVGVRLATLNIVNNDSDENPYDFSIIATGVNIDSDGDGVNNGSDSDDDNDGITDVIECGSCLTDPFTNGSFEVTSPILGATTYSIMPAANVTGWQSSPENLIEIWSTGFLGVPAAQGNQFAELNANVPGTLYQTFCLNGASGTIAWSIKHRGRDGVDQAFVRFGSTLLEAQTNAPVATMVDGTAAWGLYSGTYIIPAGQTQIVLAFQAGYTASGSASIGNFIDDVQITINQACIDTDGDGVVNIIDLDDDNDGIPDIEEAGYKAYSNNSSTFDKTNTAHWRDTNANGINDIIDTQIAGGTYLIPDADGDTIPNYIDLDSDNDSIFDVDEGGLFNGDGDINGDGKGDGADTDRDGLLNLYDNTATYGTVARAYASDTNANGIADYLQLDSNADGINDIKTSLYSNLDANNDGKIDGTIDIDRDGILDTFDTNTAATGSPRDLNRKLFLDFDGRNDYGQDATALGSLSNASVMAWVDLNNAFVSTGVIVAGPSTFQLRINSARNLEVVVNGSTVAHTAVALNTSQWYHVGAVYNGATVKLYLNGAMVTFGTATGSIASSALTLGKNPSAANNYFNGKIDELRIFDIALTDAQFQRMVYQEIQNNASQVRGAIVAKDIEGVPYSNILRYYRMDAFKDDIVDNLITPSIDSGTGMKIYNHKVIKVQEAPMPFVTKTSGTFATAVNDATKDIRGLDVTDFDYSIIQVKHNITETANATDLAMFVDPGVTITMNNNTKIQNDWYLKLDGKIDLQGKSQLVQTANSELDVTSAGSIERDQQGQSNKFNYNYWSSPVGALSATTNNNAFTINSVLRDGTDPNNIQNITWTSGYDGAATSPVTLSSYWIFKFQNLTPDYSNWSAVGQNGTLQPAQGFTLKGSAAGTISQNYTFAGKPNNGTITTPIAAGNLNLCGNPYPSALDADAFIAANSGSIAGTLYFWEHYNTNSSHNLLDYQGGYAARNLVGGTPPVSPTGVSGSGSSSRIPSRFIPVGQGFLVYGSGTGGTITFNNNQRAFVKENEATSNVMFRQSNAYVSIIDKQFDNHEDRVTETDVFSKIRLGFNSVNNYHRQILLGFMNQFATDGFDTGYDASQLDSQPNDLYFSIPGRNLVIQGVGAFDASKILPLSVKNGLAGNVQFTLDAVEHLDSNQSIYIHDNLTDEYHDIRNGHFEINLPIGTFDSRFSLRFSSSSLGVNDLDLNQGVLVSFTNDDNTININNNLTDAAIKSVELYNTLGQSIRSWNIEDTNQTKIQIPVTSISTGAYIVKLQTTKGDLSKKIIIK